MQAASQNRHAIKVLEFAHQFVQGLRLNRRINRQLGCILFRLNAWHFCIVCSALSLGNKQTMWIGSQRGEQYICQRQAAASSPHLDEDGGCPRLGVAIETLNTLSNTNSAEGWVVLFQLRPFLPPPSHTHSIVKQKMCVIRAALNSSVRLSGVALF